MKEKKETKEEKKKGKGADPQFTFLAMNDVARSEHEQST